MFTKDLHLRVKRPAQREAERPEEKQTPIRWESREAGGKQEQAERLRRGQANARRIPGLVLFRWDAPLFFANAQVFHEHVLRAVATAPTRTRRVVVAAEPVTDVDTPVADMLLALDAELTGEGMDLFFAEMKGPVKDRRKRHGLFAQLGAGNFLPTIEQAADSCLEQHRIERPDRGRPSNRRSPAGRRCGGRSGFGCRGWSRSGLGCRSRCGGRSGLGRRSRCRCGRRFRLRCAGRGLGGLGGELGLA